MVRTEDGDAEDGRQQEGGRRMRLLEMEDLGVRGQEGR